MSNASQSGKFLTGRRSRAFSLYLLLSLSPLSLRGDDSMQCFMKNFSISFEGLERGLSRGDVGAVSKHAKLLGAATTGLTDVLSPATEAAHSDVGALGRKLEILAAETAGLASRGRFADARQALEELRETCVSCHLKNRGENREDRSFPARGNTIYGQLKIFSSSGEARDVHSEVVVFLDGFPVAVSFRLPRKCPSVSQKNRQFFPRVLPVLKGTTVDFPNDDTIFHNVFSLSRARPFDLDIYESGQSRSVTFTSPGLVTAYCNIHSHMVCHILVLENPYFTVTDDSGFFAISGVPDGAYALRTWHKLGGDTRREIEVSGDGLFRVSTIVVRETRRTLTHKNKFGKRYRGDYK